MANKLDRIEKDIEKTKGKIAELQKQCHNIKALLYQIRKVIIR